MLFFLNFIRNFIYLLKLHIDICTQSRYTVYIVDWLEVFIISTSRKVNYDTAYQKENIKQIKINLNKKTDAKLIEHLEKQPNKQGYIKKLIADDMLK